MSCGCDINPNLEISSCGVPANRDDVVRLFNTVLNNCCLGIINTVGVDPTLNAVEAFDEAFPDGVTSCACECIYMRHAITGQIYINCSSNYTDENYWCVVCPPHCLGFLETEGLTPDDPLERIDAIDEAFPLGLDNACEIHYIEREDGILCYSTDDGLTWHCPLDNRYIATLNAEGTGDLFNPTGTNVSGQGQLMRFFRNFGTLFNDTDVANLIDYNDTTFTVNRSGRYIIKFCFQYRCPTNTIGTKTDFSLLLRDDVPTVIGESFCTTAEGIGGSSGDTGNINKCAFFDVDLNVGVTYQVRFKFTNTITSITQQGKILSRDFEFEFLG